MELWRIFHNMENKDLFPAKSTDAEIFEILRAKPKPPSTTPKASSGSGLTNSGWLNPTSKSFKTAASWSSSLASTTVSVRGKQLKSTANLEFWETYFNDEVIGRLGAVNAALGEATSPELYGENAPADSTLTEDQLRAKNPLFSVFQMELSRRSPVVGYTLTSDTNRVNDLLRRPEARQAIGSDLRLLWEAKPATNVAQLFAVKDPSGKGKLN